MMGRMALATRIYEVLRVAKSCPFLGCLFRVLAILQYGEWNRWIALRLTYLHFEGTAFL